MYSFTILIKFFYSLSQLLFKILINCMILKDCSSKNCIKHWFAVHTKYEIAPPFPPLSSDTVIIPGIALFHSGDIFHSLSVCAEKFELIKEPEVEHTSGRPSPRIQSPACSQTEVNSSLCSSCVNQVSKVHEITGKLTKYTLTGTKLCDSRKIHRITSCLCEIAQYFVNSY